MILVHSHGGPVTMRCAGSSRVPTAIYKSGRHIYGVCPHCKLGVVMFTTQGGRDL